MIKKIIPFIVMILFGSASFYETKALNYIDGTKVGDLDRAIIVFLLCVIGFLIGKLFTSCDDQDNGGGGDVGGWVGGM